MSIFLRSIQKEYVSYVYRNKGYIRWENLKGILSTLKITVENKNLSIRGALKDY